MQQTKPQILLATCNVMQFATKYANRVLFGSLGLDSSLQVVIKKVCIWSQIYPICNIERQVTTNCFHHSCYGNY